jgi:hypothetical protein
MRLWPTVAQWKAWTLPSKYTIIGTLIGAISLGFYVIDRSFQLTETKTYKIGVFKGRKHLGDNIYARVGGITLPNWDSPHRQGFDGLIFYDKENHTFHTTWGTPEVAQDVASHYKPILQNYNLGAWRHIRGLDTEVSPKYEGAAIKIDSKTTLIWEEDKGDFYYRFAPFAWVTTVNLYKELRSLNIDPAKQAIKSAKLIITGFHGGKREEQPEQVELFINGQTYRLSFASLKMRNEEVMVVNLRIEDLKLAPTDSCEIAIIVLPFAEKYPLPPPNSTYKQIGPAHFRDIEVGDSFIEITI